MVDLVAQVEWVWPPPKYKVLSGGAWTKACNTVLMKQVFPRFTRPLRPAGRPSTLPAACVRLDKTVSEGLLPSSAGSTNCSDFYVLLCIFGSLKSGDVGCMGAAHTWLC